MTDRAWSLSRFKTIVTRTRPTTADRPVKVLAMHPSSELYGADRMFLASVRALSDAGAVVTVSCPPGTLSAALSSTGMRTRYIHTPVTRKSLLRPKEFLRYVWQSLTSIPRYRSALHEVDPDVVYINTITLPIPLLTRSRHRRYICHVRESEDAVPRLLKFGLKLPLCRADLLICNSRTSQAFVTEAPVAIRGSSVVLYNGLARQLSFMPLDERAASPTLLVIGRLSPRKGQDIAIQAAREVAARLGTPVTVDLVGDVFPGYEWYVDELRELASAARGQVDVRFRGFRDSIKDSLVESHLLLVPSRVEPFGTVALEGIAVGRPCVVRYVQGLSEIADATGCGRVQSDDPQDWADEIIRILGMDRGSLQAWLTECSVHARGTFSMEAYSERLSELVLRRSR